MKTENKWLHAITFPTTRVQDNGSAAQTGRTDNCRANSPNEAEFASITDFYADNVDNVLTIHGLPKIIKLLKKKKKRKKWDSFLKHYTTFKV